MNPKDHQELSELKAELHSLRSQFETLTARVQLLSVKSEQTTAEPSTATASGPAGETPRHDLNRREPATAPKPKPQPTVAPPDAVPPVIEPNLHQRLSRGPTPAKSAPPRLPATASTRSCEDDETRGSVEMRLGTYWLSRIGIVMLLTAMVFFGKYAYEHYVAAMGPGAKVVLLYLAGGLLIGFGQWLQHRTESLRNYGQVLLAGGLAAVYFTTYGAYHLPALKVLSSALIDGVLLLAWAGVVLWVADRKRSQVLALFAVCLAFYTGIMTQAGLFTLFSNLVLTATAVVFLIRNRWATVSMAGLVASYAGYAYWRLFPGLQDVAGPIGDTFWTGTVFLMAYWLTFTAGVFLASEETLSQKRRAGFATANNLAFFVLVLLTLWQSEHSGFWLFSLVYGVVLIGLAGLGRLAFSDPPVAARTYLIQGLLLFTVGLIAKFSGAQLGLMLAAESVVTLTAGYLVRSPVLRWSATVVGLVAASVTLVGMNRFDRADLWLGSGVGALLLFNGFWSRRRLEDPATRVDFTTAWFTGLALSIWLITTMLFADPRQLPLILGVEALLFVGSIYLIRVPELLLGGQTYLVMGQLVWIQRSFSPVEETSGWQALGLLAITLFLSHWWQHQRFIREFLTRTVICGLYGLALVVLLFGWLEPVVDQRAWVAVASLLAVAVTVYGLATRLWMLAAAGQLLLGVSAWGFLERLIRDDGSWLMSLGPMLALVGLALGVSPWLTRRSEATASVLKPVALLARIYQWSALALAVLWVFQYIPVRHQCWVLALLGGFLFALGIRRSNQEVVLASAILSGVGLGVFWLFHTGALSGYLPSLLAIGLIMGEQQWARRHAEGPAFPERFHVGVMAVCSLSIWAWMTRWVLAGSEGFLLTVAWACLAFGLFLIGLGIKERVYRWAGLMLLGLALGRVVILDVWKLEIVYRMFSFLALGLVLLVLGFIYNHYQDRLKQWL